MLNDADVKQQNPYWPEMNVSLIEEKEEEDVESYPHRPSACLMSTGY